mmetsp:Transcript_20238/g.41696  ORF Transcript_20238/g.41696 Transcript_20238/m.41696 type:complete len:307 (+) Transcript_20238:118-1038(+)
MQQLSSSRREIGKTRLHVITRRFQHTSVAISIVHAVHVMSLAVLVHHLMAAIVVHVIGRIEVVETLLLPLVVGLCHGQHGRCGRLHLVQVLRWIMVGHIVACVLKTASSIDPPRGLWLLGGDEPTAPSSLGLFKAGNLFPQNRGSCHSSRVGVALDDVREGTRAVPPRSVFGSDVVTRLLWILEQGIGRIVHHGHHRNTAHVHIGTKSCGNSDALDCADRLAGRSVHGFVFSVFDRHVLEGSHHGAHLHGLVVLEMGVRQTIVRSVTVIFDRIQGSGVGCISVEHSGGRGLALRMLRFLLAIGIRA